MNLVFATNNKNKIIELNSLIKGKINLYSLNDINCLEELPETQTTIEGNAKQKAEFVFSKYQVNCFADDTGLEIEALKGKPGVFSARYAGEKASSDENMNKVLTELNSASDRSAQFKTVIHLIINGEHKAFEGIVKGEIIKEKRGSNGFGYDPIFIPAGYDKTFAEMDLSLKNKISHRALAVNKLVDYLNSLTLK